ncbi:hypothetical protein CRUP_006243, partial [Coryphaenoides rupestris]
MSSTKEIWFCGGSPQPRRFAALQGGFLENDVRFWLEVQKFK